MKKIKGYEEYQTKFNGLDDDFDLDDLEKEENMFIGGAEKNRHDMEQIYLELFRYNAHLSTDFDLDHFLNDI